MPLQPLSVDISVLPNDVLSFYDDTFYRMVAIIAGPTEAKLLEAQGIRSVYSFLNTEDVFDILSISCTALKDIKKSICLIADDDTFIVKPGCRSNIRYLYQLLHQKHEENLKKIKQKPRRNQQSQIPTQQHDVANLDSSQDPSNASSPSLNDQQCTATSG